MERENPFVKRAIDLCGGTQSGLARKIGGKVRQGHVWKWLQSEKLTPEAAVLLDTATDGRVSKHEMRPEIFGPVPPAANSEQQEAA